MDKSTFKQAPKTENATEIWPNPYFENIPILMGITDAQGLILSINTAGIHLLGGSSLKGFCGRYRILDFFADANDIEKLCKTMGEKHQVKEFETTFRRLDGQLLDVSITGKIRRNSQGESLGYEGFIIDTTDSKVSKRAFREMSETYNTVVENSLAAISVHQDGINRFVNRRYAEMLGYGDPSECIGKPFWSSVHPEDVAMVRERGLMREKRQILPSQYVFRQLKKDKKTVVWVQIR